MTKSFNIQLPYIDQQVVIGSDITLQELISVTASYSQIVILIDTNVLQIKLKKVLDDLKKSQPTKKMCIIKLFPDRYFKSLEYATSIFADLADHGITRNTVLIAIGGGFVGDVGGFIASVYMRGLAFVQVGTTLMSQVDAIIGKVAVNVGHKKNVVGSFFSPVLTICDQDLIKTDPKEILLAVAEVFKHYLFSTTELTVIKSKIDALEELLKANQHKEAWAQVIEESLKIKALAVQQDPYDSNGIHKKLSFGHTFANILESELHMRHGEAVWVGMYLATKLLLRLESIGKDSLYCDYILQAIERFYAVNSYKTETLHKVHIESALLSDKITKDNKPTFIVCPKPGEYKVINSDIDDVLAVFNELFTLI